MTQSIQVSLSAAQALTDPQAAAAYRVLVANARNQPNQPVALSVQTAAAAVTALGLATTAQLSAAVPPPAAPDPTVAAQAQLYRLGQLEAGLAQRTTETQTRAEAAQQARQVKARADARALGLTVKDEDHR